MTLSKVWDYLEKEIFSIESSEILFNPYAETNLETDLPKSAKIRRDNLHNYLESFTTKPSVLIIGEAPGYRGCRFSGVPFTSEYQLVNGVVPFSGLQSSKREKPRKESSASIFWENMIHYFPKFFIWNCVPLHPHKSNEVESNRRPNPEEILRFSRSVSEILALLEPKTVLALGKSAKHALDKIGQQSNYIRHPSHGGKEEFKQGIEKYLSKLQS